MYLYLLNRPSFQDQIAYLEFYSLTGVKVDTGFGLSSKYIDSGRPAYIDMCIDIIFIDDTKDGLYKKIKSLKYKKDKYRVRFLNTGIHFKFNERKTIEREISDIFEGAPDLKNPDDDFIVTFTGQNYIFGIFMWKSENRWLQFEKKPHTFCNALPARMSRALANIASMNNPGKSFVDPCCGMGTVLIQAADMGYEIQGFDINPIVSRDARENLAYFGFKPSVECRDASLVSGSYAISVLDLPYGLLSKKGSDQYEEIVGNLRKLCTQAVILSGEDISGIINGAGFDIIQKCIVHKGGLDRHIALCR